MARDYYPLIARAVAGLEEKTAEARRTVYDHARTVLARLMRDLDASLSTRLHERRALEDAIDKAESEAAGAEGISPHAGSRDIAERAYLLWKQAGSPEGRALEFWLQAEAECAAEPSGEQRNTRHE
jgi:hypothetical protein